MGAALSSNVADMVADVYSSSTSTTTITNTNSNAAAQSLVLDGCDITAEQNINIVQSLQQVQSIQQTAAVQNTQLSSTLVDQSLIQQAQSSVSSWGIGVASASNNMSVATSVSTSVKNAVDESFSNLNSLTQNITCTDSSLTANSGDVNISQTGSQAITATQVSSSTNLQDVTTSVSQSASQTATATVSGLDLMGMIVAAIVLVVVLGVVMAIVKSKATQQLRSAGLQGGGLYKLTSAELKLYVAAVVLAVILAVLGAVGLQQRPHHACDFTGQCTPTSPSQFWFSTSDATCSVPDRYTTLSSSSANTLPTAPLATLVAPPLFLCNTLRAPAEFGASAPPTLYPGTLQLLVVASKAANAASTATSTTAPQRNNSGYNAGVYSLLLRTATETASVTGGPSDASRTMYIQALAAWFVRQTITLDADGQPFVATPASTDPWCANRILRDLLPIQPVFTEPQAGFKCTAVKTDTEVTVPAKTSTLHRKGRGQGTRTLLWQGRRRRQRPQRHSQLTPPAGRGGGGGGSVRLATGTACAAATGTDLTQYLVRLPGSFLASSTTTSASESATTYITYLCLPNAFVPDLAAAGKDAALFLGNHTASESFPSALTCNLYASDTATAPTVTGTSRPVFKTTCVQTAQEDNSADVTTDRPRLATDYACGCLTVEASEVCWGDGADMYHDSDLLCYVNSGIATHTTATTSTGATDSKTTYSRRGGFILRRADTFTSTVYDAASALDTDLYKYAAVPSWDRLEAWVAANPGAAQRRRLHMFLRVYWWLLLTIDVKNRTLSELGLSTFVNEAGFDAVAKTPNVPLDRADVSALAMYGAQPLLVKKSNSTYAFYSLQELQEGVVAGAGDAARTTLSDKATCLAQVGMWCYDASSLGLYGAEIASNGFNVTVTSAKSASAQLSQSTGQRGLLVGRHGFCKLWFTGDVFVASTLGAAGAIFVLLIVYGIAMNVR